MADDAFSIDYEYDSDHADHAGGSRYGDYIRNSQDWFAVCWDRDDPKADFAAAAWRIASGPVMSPGYVRHHPKILRAALERSDWDGRLLACVDLITPAPQALRQSSEWGGGRWWRDWPAESLIGREAYYEPGGEDLGRDPYILPSVSLRWAVPDRAVLDPPADKPSLPELQHAAKHCVVALVAELNRTVNPVLAQLERSLWLT
jgi:hypothetical protein